MVFALQNIFREMFDLITFFKPVKIFVEEKRSIAFSAACFGLVVASFFVISVLLNIIFNYSSFADISIKNAIFSVSYFLFFLVVLALSSFIAFSVGSIFGKKYSLEHLISINYYLGACVSLMILVRLVPFADFAAFLLGLLGAGLYLFFLNDIYEVFFEISSLKSFVLLFLSAAIIAAAYFAILSIFGLLQIPVV